MLLFKYKALLKTDTLSKSSFQKPVIHHFIDAKRLILIFFCGGNWFCVSYFIKDSVFVYEENVCYREKCKENRNSIKKRELEKLMLAV